MPPSDDPADEINALMAAARKIPHNFVLMKTKDGVVIEAHKTKEARALLPLAKARGGMPAISCSGIMTVQGRLINLAVDDPDVPGTLPLLAKRHLKSIGVMAKVQITLPSGAVIGDGDEAEDGDAPEVAPEVAPVVAPEVAPEVAPDSAAAAAELPVAGDTDRKAALNDRLQKLVPGVRSAAEKGVPGVDRLVQAIRTAGTMVASGSFDEAEKIIAVVERALSQPAKPGATATGTTAPGDAAALAAELRALAAQVAAIPDAERKLALARLASAGGTALKAGDMAVAAARIAELRMALNAQPQGNRKTQPLVPVWQGARDTVNDQLGRLQAAMRNHGMPLFARIADKGLNGVTERHLVPLQIALIEMDQAQGEARAAAAALARRRVDAMRAFLQSNPVLPLLEANPLKVPVTVRATLGAALDDISRALTA